MKSLILHRHPDRASRHFPGFSVEKPMDADPSHAPSISYFPHWTQGVLPDLEAARRLLKTLARHPGPQVRLISSALVLQNHYRNPGLMAESRVIPTRLHTPISRGWNELEQLFQDSLPADRLCILRIPPCPLLEPDSLFGSLAENRRLPAIRLFDPPLQFLHPKDLAQALALAEKAEANGVYHLAPDKVLRPRLLLERDGWRRGFPSAMKKGPHRPDEERTGKDRVQDTVIDERCDDISSYGTTLLPGSAPVAGARALQPAIKDCFRYPWTLSDDKARAELGYRPAHDSFEALGLPAATPGEAARLDPFGMNPDYVESHCKGFSGFIHNRYFRVEYRGEEHLPQDGKLILLGIHRGFMPIDGYMLMSYFMNRHRRIIRTPVHPSLLKTPLPFNFAALGGFPAHADNMDRIIQSEQWMLLFPEGVNGAFKLYRDAYQLSSQGFAEAAACAIRNRAPIVPVLTLGSAEIFPILKKLHWPWFQNKTLWPAFPLAPPFPLLPFPLPTKWRTHFFPAIHLERDYDPAAADTAVIQRVGSRIKEQMQDGLLELRQQRTSWWW